MWCRLAVIFFLTSLAQSISNDGLAQSTPATLRYFCLFEKFASPDGIEPAKDFTLEFLVETASGNAVMIGNNGFSEQVMVRGRDAITFLERLPTGAVQSTTIADNNQAVHSRHSVILSDLVPSQYYGSCRVVSGKGP